MGSDCDEHLIFDKEEFDVSIVSDENSIDLRFSDDNDSVYFPAFRKKDIRKLIKSLEENIGEFKGK